MLWQLSFLVFAQSGQIELTSKSRGDVKNVEVVPVAADGSARWSPAGGVYDVVVGYGCSEDIAFDFWPILGKCSGHLFLKMDKDRLIKSYDNKIAQLKAEEDAARKKLGPFGGLSVGSEFASKTTDLLLDRYKLESYLIRNNWHVPAHILQDNYDFSALQRGSHVLGVDGAFFDLQGFGPVSERVIAEGLNAERERVGRERQQIVGRAFFTVLALVLGGCATILLFRFARKRLALAKEKAKQFKDVAADQVDKLQAAHQRRKVRAVVMDETIREMTRAAVGGADARSKELLVAELRKAIESGNHELANALELALKKT
jgi:hypothetical protein